MEARIGIAVTTTPSRKSVYDDWVNSYLELCPQLPVYRHNDINYKGVVYSKNKCLQVLYDNGFDYLFLFDDDCLIAAPNFYEQYINSRLEHAAYTFSRQLIRINDNYAEYVDPNGCMLFFTRNCIDKAGGWDTDFKGYGYEHSELSSRIHNIGLTPARFIDIPNSKGLFKMAKCESSFSHSDRLQIPNNLHLYQQKFNSKEFKPFK